MFTTLVTFDNNIDEAREIDFLILPKIGETIAYGTANKKYYRVDHIIHTVDASNDQGQQQLNIMVSEIRQN